MHRATRDRGLPPAVLCIRGDAHEPPPRAARLRRRTGTEEQPIGEPSPRVDAYTDAAEPFARPILVRIRRLFHEACPEIAETLEWGAPFFEHRGLVGSMSAIQRHVALGFWKGDQLTGPERHFTRVGRSLTSMLKLASVDELPPTTS